MLTQKSLKDQTILKRFVLGAHPIIQYFIDMLNIPEIISSYLKDDARIKIDEELILCMLIHNCLVESIPLYQIQDWLRPLDTEQLGIGEKDVDLIYDERVGRTLDKFYDSRINDIFFQVALRAIEVFDLDCSEIHQDTTTVTFTGRYDDWNVPEKVTYGHNKDYRPDLKQLVLGISITADGNIPISHKIYSGNKTDSKVHQENHKHLQKLLKTTEFIYTADSKLATDENLSKIERWSGLFVSVMPRSWKENERFLEQVIADKVNWTHILSRANNRQPNTKLDKYYLAEGSYQTNREYILYWVKSSTKQSLDYETRENNLNHVFEKLNELKTKINKYSLKTYDRIESRVNEILDEKNCHNFVRYEIKSHEEVIKKHRKKGRPSSKNVPTEIRVRYFKISFSRNNEAILNVEKCDGIFPLITNLDRKNYSAKHVLEIYKRQGFLEKRNSQIKTYQRLTPVYLKKDKRVMSIINIQILALTVASLIERKIRQEMQQRGLESIDIYPEKRACKKPTLFDIVRLFNDVERYEVSNNGEPTIFPAELSKEQKLVLEMLNVSPNKYC